MIHLERQLLLSLALTLGVCGQLAAQRRANCGLCHGELEFLRQHTATLVEARAALVPDSVVDGSAHFDLACTECHQRFGQFPHSQPGSTRSCVSCHEKADTAWRRGAHVKRADSEGASCAQCHGVHHVAKIDELKTRERSVAFNRSCIGCHQAERLHADNPHADSTLCAACHGAHDIQRKDVPASRLWAVTQVETCGTCHDSVASIWKQNDVHYRALTSGKQQANTKAAAALVRKQRAPTCTDCHGAHGLNVNADSLRDAAAVTRCGECHQDAQKTFADSYHGKATLLGSKASATCADCHGSHEILPQSEPTSRVASANLVETCGECHEHARPGFVKYDSHPEMLNRARNPWIFASFWFMNSLLAFVIVVFGAHTLLWWLRLYLDRKKGNSE